MTCQYEQEFPRFLAAPVYSRCLLDEGHDGDHVVKDCKGKRLQVMRDGQNPRKEYVR